MGADALLVSLASHPATALAAGCLISWARRDEGLAGLSLDALEADSRADPAVVARRILARSPRLVGLSSYVWNHRAVREVARVLKEASPATRIVLGGPEVAEAAERELARSPWVDFVCRGEGEETFRLLLRSLFLGDGPLELVPGLAYREEAGIRLTPEAELIDLGAAPSPYLTGLTPLAPGQRAIVETSRGCPFTCKFCDWGPRVMRYVPDARLEAEFQRLAGLTDVIALADADLTMHRERCLRVLDMFLRATRGHDCVLAFDLNPVFLGPEIVEAIARAPERFFLAMGLQSIDESVLRRINRTFDRERVERNLARLRDRCPRTKYQFSIIYGLPGDDRQGLRRTLDWCLGQRPAFLVVNQALILPGSELAKEAGPLGLRFQDEPPHQVLSTDRMDGAEMALARELAVYAQLVGWLPQVYPALLDAASRLEGVERPYLAVLEAWIAALKDAGIDLAREGGWSRTDDRLVSSAAGQALAEVSPLLRASIARVTQRLIDDLPSSLGRLDAGLSRAYI